MAAPRRKRYSIIVTNDTKELNANHLALYTPDLKDVAEAVTKGLQENFESVEVKIHDECPKLNEFGNLPAEVHGICGNARIAEVGGVPYLYTKKHQKTEFSINNICTAAGIKQGQQPLLFGTATPDASVENKNGEVVVNLHGVLNNHSKLCVMGSSDELKMQIEKTSYKSDDDIAKSQQKKRDSVDENNLKQMLEQVQKEENKNDNEADSGNDDQKNEHLIITPYTAKDIGCKANLFICNGKNNEPVLYVKVSKRTGKLDVIEALREALKMVKGVEKTTQIGVGGVLRVRKGKVKVSVSNPEYVELDYTKTENIEKTRQVHEIGPDLVMFTTFLTGDPSENQKYHLTLASTGCYYWNEQKPHLNVNQGGIFVESASNEVEYEGYFVLAKYVYRVEDAYYNIQMENAAK